MANGVVTGVDMDAAYWLVLVLGVVGGGVGVAVVAPLVRTPRELDDHDTRTEHLNQDGARWIMDRKLKLDGQLSAITHEHNKAGALMSGSHINARQIAIEDAAHELRDRVVSAEQECKVMADQERWWHHWWEGYARAQRLRKDGPRPTLDLRAQAVTALTAWRSEHEEWAPSAGAPARAWRYNELVDPPPPGTPPAATMHASAATRAPRLVLAVCVLIIVAGLVRGEWPW